MLARDDQVVLSRLERSGGWQRGAESIELVRVCVVNQSGDTCEVGLGVQDDRGAYLLAWRGERSGGGWRFSAMPVSESPSRNVVDLDGAPLTPLGGAPAPAAAEGDENG